MKKELIDQLAKQAGFVFWEDGRGIDWGSDYDNDIIRFANLIVEHCAQVCEDHFSSDGDWCAKQLRRL